MTEYKSKSKFWSLKYTVVIGLSLMALYIVSYAYTKDYNSRFIPRSDILHDSLNIIANRYFDQTRIDPSTMFKAALLNISKQVPPVLVKIEESGSHLDLAIKVGPKEMSFQSLKLGSLADLEKYLQEIFQFIKKNLADDDIENLAEVDYAATNGLLSALDPHSNLLTPQIYQNFTTDAQGEYAGVGMLIRAQEGKIHVIAVIGDDSPAAKSGVKGGDLILQIDQYSTAGMSVEDAKNKLRGPKKSEVNVLIEREGEKDALKIKLIRDEIKLSSVRSYKFTADGASVGYIKISRVMANSNNELEGHLTRLGVDLSDFKGLILDLRNNPGGLLSQAVNISNNFLNSGTIVSIAGVDKKDIVHYQAKPFGTTESFPIIVLVNKFSASAAEIIAGALQKNHRAIVVGERTFGKGTVQSLVEKFADGSGLKLTTSQYLTPGERSIQSVGIVPEVLIVKEIITPEFVQILPVTSRSEKELDNSLDLVALEDPDSSLVQLNYLDSTATSGAPEDLSDYVGLTPENLQRDFWITTARRILLSADSEDYQELLNAAKDYVALESVQQEKIISKTLTDLGVSWGQDAVTATDHSAPTLEINFSVEKQAEKDQFATYHKPFPSETAGRLVIAVTNRGALPRERLVGVVRSDNLLFDGRQFVIGDLKPQENRIGYVYFKTRIFEIASSNKLTIDFKEGKNSKFQTSQQLIDFAGSQLPVLSYRYDFKGKNSNSAQPIAANGNRIEVDLTITNRSAVATGPVTIALKNGDIDFITLNLGHSEILDIPGNSKVERSFTLSFTDIPKDGKYDVLFAISPTNYPILNVEQKIALTHNSQAASFTNDPPIINIIGNRTVKDQKFNFNASVKDDGRLKDIFVFHNNTKIFYTRLAEEKNAFSLSLPVDLEAEESNTLSLIATDHQGVKTQRILKVLSP